MFYNWRRLIILITYLFHDLIMPYVTRLLFYLKYIGRNNTMWWAQAKRFYDTHAQGSSSNTALITPRNILRGRRHIRRAVQLHLLRSLALYEHMCMFARMTYGYALYGIWKATNFWWFEPYEFLKTNSYSFRQEVKTHNNHASMTSHVCNRA